MTTERYNRPFESMSRRQFIRNGLCVAGAAAAFGSGLNIETLLAATGTSGAGSRSLPNFIIVNADDMGYGDLSCYGSTAIRTPNLDKLADEGIRFTDFYACNALCSPSRFGLLTGRYPQRAGIQHVFYERQWSLRLGRLLSKVGGADLKGAENEQKGIPEDEITLAESLKTVGYQTAIIGKWHLGNFAKKPEYHPMNHGFDHFLGVPFSNGNNPFPLYRGNTLLEENIQGQEQGKLTSLYTKETIDFIEKSRDKPFFCYLAHTFPHQPHFSSENFHLKSDGGKYGDTVEELDWSMGVIMSCLKRNKLDENTLVIFTSDNGPWNVGSPGSLRGRKGQIFDGGFRVPMIARQPGVISAGTISHEPTMNTDFFPTCLAMAGVSLPKGRIIDGRDITGILRGTDRDPAEKELLFFHHDMLQGIRVGRWKLYRDINLYIYPTPVNVIGKRGKGPFLYDMEKDPGENYEIGAKYPDLVSKLSIRMDELAKSMAENQKGLI